jgi:phosphodiesterase/alkaline phosphatase D-like protein
MREGTNARFLGIPPPLSPDGGQFTFGPNTLDNTLGPQVVFQNVPAAGTANLSPYAGLQFFGQVDIDRRTAVMTVSLKDITGATVFSKQLPPIVPAGSQFPR